MSVYYFKNKIKLFIEIMNKCNWWQDYTWRYFILTIYKQSIELADTKQHKVSLNMLNIFYLSKFSVLFFSVFAKKIVQWNKISVLLYMFVPLQRLQVYKPCWQFRLDTIQDSITQVHDPKLRCYYILYEWKEKI